MASGQNSATNESECTTTAGNAGDTVLPRLGQTTDDVEPESTSAHGPDDVSVQHVGSNIISGYDEAQQAMLPEKTNGKERSVLQTKDLTVVSTKYYFLPKSTCHFIVFFFYVHFGATGRSIHTHWRQKHIY